MIPLLLLSHAGIALIAVFTSPLEKGDRERAAQGLAVVGAIFGLLLFFGSSFLGDGWRTTQMTPSGARIAGVAIVAAWVVVAVGERSRGGGRWDIVALTGVASTAVGLYTLNRWTIPALLFAGIAGVGVAMLNDRPGLSTAFMSVGMALLVGALLGDALIAETWRLPSPLSGTQLWLAVAAAVSFAAAAIVSESPRRPTAATPLALGLAFATLGSVASAAGPVVALAVLGVALVAVVRTLLKEQVSQRMVMIWVVALTVALASLSANPYVTTRSAIAGIVAASAIGLWPLSLGRAQIERGILVAFVAVTAGFNAMAAAASYSFARSTTIERVLEAGPWAVVAAILPAALAGGVVLGASVARNAEPEQYSRSGVLGTWAFLLLSVAVGISPFIGDDVGATLVGPGLYVVALLCGVGAARYARSLGSTEHVVDSGSHFVFVPLAVAWPRSAALASQALAALTAIGLVVATVQGLRVGFL